MELGDHSTVRCEKTGLVADIEFKTKGFIGGKYDVIHGVIRNEKTGDKLYDIEGKWNEKMTIKDLKTKKTDTFFDATQSQATLISMKSVDTMAERESRKLWRETTEAIKARDQTTATNAKSVIEDGQRDEAKARQDRGEVWHPKFFDEIGPEDYLFKASKNLSGKELKEKMEEMASGITSTRTPSAATPSTVTSSGPAAQPGQTASATATTTSGASPVREHQGSSISAQPSPAQPQPSASAELRQQQYASPKQTLSAQPSSSERPTLQPVDSENQPFHDAQESFDNLSIHSR